MIENYYDTMSNMEHNTLIDTIPLCQKARHQRDSCRHHYQSQKQRQMPYPLPLQAMIYCQCHLHLLFHEERVFHQKPWCYEDGYIIVCGCEWRNRNSKHEKYKYNRSLPQSPYWGERPEPLHDNESSWYACCFCWLFWLALLIAFAVKRNSETGL